MIGGLSSSVAGAQIRLTWPSEASSTANTKPENNGGTATPVVDWEAALDAAGGHCDLLLDVVGVTLDELPTLQRQLEFAIREHDAETAQRTAHTIKGATATIVATRTQLAAAAIEEFAANDNLDSAARQLPQLGDAIVELLQHCKDFVATQ